MADNIQKEGMLKVGSTLANCKYRIDQYLASGGFGNTYVATDTAFDDKVAIKELFIKGVCGRADDSSEISISLTENKRAFSAQQEKFRKEAKRIRKLTNPHIVSVHDLFDENGTSYYVMDFVEGESLSARLKRTKKPMSESELMLILPQSLDALECVHAEGIWHLDLKPANIMINTKGNIQLIDFGASKQLKNANGENLSTSSAMAYTAGYASSEQMEQNIEKFGPWTDLYSLGATMYNLLTMQQPPSPSDIDEDSRSALKLPSGISKKTEKLIFWLMKPNRKMRPQSVTDVKQFLVEAQYNTVPENKKVEENNDDDNDDTVIKHKKKPIEINTGGKKSNSGNGEKISKKYSNKIVIAAAVFACISVLCLVGDCGGGNNNSTGDNAKISTANNANNEIAVVEVENKLIKVSSGPTNMREYKYSGEIGAYEGAVPNDVKGKAVFEKYGDIPGSSYYGYFVNGVCEDNTGDATMTFNNGDKYVGTFVGGYYSEGKYILSDGAYFEGTFKDSKPYNGTWYSSSGTVDGTVVNGRDVDN